MDAVEILLNSADERELQEAALAVTRKQLDRLFELAFKPNYRQDALLALKRVYLSGRFQRVMHKRDGTPVTPHEDHTERYKMLTGWICEEHTDGSDYFRSRWWADEEEE